MGIFDRFINGSESDAVGFAIADADSPVNWGELSSTIIGSIAAGASSAAIGIPQGIGEAGQMVFGGAANATSEFVGAFFEPFVTVPLGISEAAAATVNVLRPSTATAALAQLWGIAFIDELGILAGPVAVAIVLAAAFVLSVGAQQAIETFRDGGGVL